MQHIQEISSHQLQVVSLEDTISQDNPVRFIGAFVQSITLERIGFRERFDTATTALFSLPAFMEHFAESGY